MSPHGNPLPLSGGLAPSTLLDGCWRNKNLIEIMLTCDPAQSLSLGLNHGKKKSFNDSKERNCP